MSAKQLLMAVAASFTLGAAAYAGDAGPQPIGYEEEVKAYFAERLENPQGARYEFTGAPYPVQVDLGGYDNLECWAIDVRVRARIGAGTAGGFIPYTVVFYEGRPVALRIDVRDFQEV
ncbi:MAG: hypothetical protein AAGC77_06950 [Pseudomonadota bacterium]